MKFTIQAIPVVVALLGWNQDVFQRLAAFATFLLNVAHTIKERKRIEFGAILKWENAVGSVIVQFSLYGCCFQVLSTTENAVEISYYLGHFDVC